MTKLMSGSYILLCHVTGHVTVKRKEINVQNLCHNADRNLGGSSRGLRSMIEMEKLLIAEENDTLLSQG
jgi:hypothetical protein